MEFEGMGFLRNVLRRDVLMELIYCNTCYSFNLCPPRDSPVKLLRDFFFHFTALSNPHTLLDSDLEIFFFFCRS